MTHSEEDWIKGRAQRQFSSDPIPAELVGRWRPVGTPFVHEFTDEGTHSNHYSISDADFAISSDGTTLSWSGFDYTRKFDTSTSLAGIWERFWPDDDVYEEFNFHVGGTYAAHWRPSNEDFFGSYFENVPAPGKLRFRELSSIITIAGSQVTFDPPYSPSRTGTFTLDRDNLSIVFPGGTVVYERVP